MKICRKLFIVAAAAAAGVLAGCSTKLSPEPFDANLRLTAGQVKLTVRKGVTTQSQIFRALGSPNVVVLDNGVKEVWTYDQIRVRRTSQGYQTGAFFGTLFGLSEFDRGAGAAGAKVGGTVGTTTTSVLTATLIIRFSADEKVESYQMMVTSF